MASPGGATSVEIQRAEHDDTESTKMKRVSVYGYDSTNLVKRRLNVDSNGRLIIDNTTNNDLALQLDDTSTANVTYIGTAAIGSATSSAVWKIKKIDETTGLVITWADGDDLFNNIWDNRASLSYS